MAEVNREDVRESLKNIVRHKPKIFDMTRSYKFKRGTGNIKKLCIFKEDTNLLKVEYGLIQ